LYSDPNISIFTNSRVTKILKNPDGSIKGVQVNDTLDFEGEAVILATGGYGRDEGLLGEFSPQYKTLPSTNGNWTTGDGVYLAREISAELVGMEYVQVHPTGIIDPKAPYLRNKFLAAEAIRAGGAILVNQKGHRFVNELGLRDHVTAAIFEHCTELPESNGQIFSYMVLNENVIQAFGEQIMSFYQHKGFLRKFENAKALCNEFDIPYENLENTIQSYNAASAAGIDEFGKTRFPSEFDLEKEIYSFLITPSIHYTMGGVKIDSSARVFDVHGKIIPGLYAAGEVTGGVHGKNRLAGNSLLECVVFGRTAAASVSAKVEKTILI